MKKFATALAVSFLASTSYALCAYTSPAYVHTQTFCPSGCDSSAGTFTVPANTSDLQATWCGSGGAGAGGYNGSSGAGGGGGGSGICIGPQTISAPPGTVITLTYSAGPTGALVGVAGVNGSATYMTWTSGAYAYTSLSAWGGGGGVVGGAANGGSGGNGYCTVNGGTGCTTPGPPYGGGVPALGAGGSGASAGANSAVSSTMPTGIIQYGSAGAGGGGFSTNGYAGGATRTFMLNGANGDVPGGAASGTLGGGGAGGSSVIALGGAGGSNAVGSNGGQAAGGGGGSSNKGGGNGGDGWVMFTWNQ